MKKEVENKKIMKGRIDWCGVELTAEEYIKFMSQYTEFLNNKIKKEKIKGKSIF